MNYLRELCSTAFFLEIEKNENILWLLVTFKDVSVYKTRVVFVVIHKVWKKWYCFLHNSNPSSSPAGQHTVKALYRLYQTASHSAKAVLSKLRPSVGGGSSRGVQPSRQSGSRCASVGSWQSAKPKASQQGRKTMSRQARKEHLDCRCAAAWLPVVVRWARLSL